MRRRAATLVEALVAFVVATLVLGAATTLLTSMNAMSRSGDLSAALQDAGFALAQIESDVRGAVAKPDDAGTAVRVARGRVQLVRAGPEPDGRVGGQLVTYTKERAASGEWRLRREQGASSSWLPGRYKDVVITLLDGPGGPFVRVSLTVAGRPAGVAEAMSSALVRVPALEMRGSAHVDFGFLDGAKGVAWR